MEGICLVKTALLMLQKFWIEGDIWEHIVIAFLHMALLWVCNLTVYWIQVEISSPFLLFHSFFIFNGSLDESSLRAGVKYCLCKHTMVKFEQFRASHSALRLQWELLSFVHYYHAETSNSIVLRAVQRKEHSYLVNSKSVMCNTLLIIWSNQ